MGQLCAVSISQKVNEIDEKLCYKYGKVQIGMAVYSIQ